MHPCVLGEESNNSGFKYFATFHFFKLRPSFFVHRVTDICGTNGHRVNDKHELQTLRDCGSFKHLLTDSIRKLESMHLKIYNGNK